VTGGIAAFMPEEESVINSTLLLAFERIKEIAGYSKK